MNDDHRWPCTPICVGPCGAECEQPSTPPMDIDPEVANAVLDLSVLLAGALGEQCHGHLRRAWGGGIRCRRVVDHPPDRGLFADYPATHHVYGVGPDGGEEPNPETWSDDAMGATSHREWWALYGEGEMRRSSIKGEAS